MVMFDLLVELRRNRMPMRAEMVNEDRPFRLRRKRQRTCRRELGIYQLIRYRKNKTKMDLHLQVASKCRLKQEVTEQATTSTPNQQT